MGKYFSRKLHIGRDYQRNCFRPIIRKFYISLSSYLVNKYKLRQDVLKAIIDNVGSDKVRDIRGKIFGVGGLSREDQLALHRGKSIERNDCKLNLEEVLTLIVGYDRLAYQFGNSDISYRNLSFTDRFHSCASRIDQCNHFSKEKR